MNNLKVTSKLLMILMLGIFLFSMVGAVDYDSHKQSTDYTLVANSNNATACTLTYIRFPNGSNEILNIGMTRNLTTFYTTIDGGNFSALGDTCLGISCTDGTTNQVGGKCLDVNGNGKDNPSGAVIVLFSLVFLIIMVFLIYELIMVIGHFASLDLDAVDLAKSLGTYFGLFALYELAQFYLGNPDIENWMLILIKVGAFTHVIVPITGFLISITVGSLSKKKMDFGTKRIYKRYKIGKV